MKNNIEYSIADLKVGQSGIVKKISISDRKIKRHLLDMGITKGTRIRVKRIAPMGDPINIVLRDYELCIRKADLKQIYVEVIE